MITKVSIEEITRAKKVVNGLIQTDSQTEMACKRLLKLTNNE